MVVAHSPLWAPAMPAAISPSPHIAMSATTKLDSRITNPTHVLGSWFFFSILLHYSALFFSSSSSSSSFSSSSSSFFSFLFLFFFEPLSFYRSPRIDSELDPLAHARRTDETIKPRATPSGNPSLADRFPFPSFLPSLSRLPFYYIFFLSFSLCFFLFSAETRATRVAISSSGIPFPPLRKEEHGSLPANEAANAARAFYRRGRNVAALWKNVGKNTRGSINEKYDSLYLYSSPSLPPSPSPFFSPTPFPLPGNF